MRTTLRLPRHRRLLFAVAVATVTAAVAGCGSGGSASQASAGASKGESTTVRITTDPFVLGAQMWVARDRGYFDREHLTVEPQTYQTGVDGMKAMLARQADFAPALDFPVLSSLSDRIRILGAIANPSPGFYRLAVRSDIRSKSDLAGKRIGYVPGTSVHYVASKYLENNHISARLVAFPGPFEAVGALKSGQVDAAWVWTSGIAEVQKDHNLRLLDDDSDALTDGSLILLTASTDYVREHPDTVKQVLTAYKQATDFLRRDPDQATAIIAKAVKGDAKQIAAANAVENWGLGFSKANLKYLRTMYKFMVDAKLIKGGAGDITDYLDLRALRSVVPDRVDAVS